MQVTDDSQPEYSASESPETANTTERHETLAPARDAATERRRMRGATIIFAAATFLSRIAGLLREIVTAAIFGATTTMSAFTIANQIPNLLRSLVADSAMSAAFVPVFTELREHEERERAWNVASAVCGILVAVLGPLTVLMMIITPWMITPFLSQTFTPEDVELTIGLARVLMPIVLILALSGVVVGLLNAHDRFGAAALAPVAWNAVILISLVIAYAFVPTELQIWVLAIGTLVGTIVQAVLPVPWLRGLGGRLRIRAHWRDPKVREVFILMLPVTVSLGLINVQQFIASLFAAAVAANELVAGLDPGAGPSIIDKAFRIYMLPQGIFSVAVSTVVFPVLARLATRDDRTGFAQTVDSGLRQIIILLVPSSLFLGVFAVPVTRVLYERGNFDAAQTTAVALVLIAFAFGLTFNGLSLLLIRSLFSLRATWLPALVAVVTLVVNVVLDVLLYEQWGVLGIAAAISAANIVAVVLLYFMLQRRTDPLGTRRTLAVAGGSLGVGIVGVAAAAGVYIAWEQWAGRSGITSFVGVCAALAVMTPIYLELGARVGVVPRGLLRSILRRQ